MRHLFDTPLGAQVAPIGSFKLLWLLDDLIGAVGNMASTMYAADASEMNTIRTNNANREINESQLAWARQQYEDEKAENRFLVDQAYERELENREYNTPAALRQRLLDAGFNPSMAFGNVGSSTGHISVPTGSAPHANQPNMIPMQSPPPVVPPDIGQYFSRMADHMFKAQEEERADYALASDIQASNMNAYANLIKAFSEAQKSGADIGFLKDEMKRAWESIWLEKDKFAAENEWRSVTNDIQQREIALKEFDSYVKASATDAQIRLSNAQISQISQLVKESIQRVDNMAAENDLSYKEYQLALSRDIFDRKAELLRIGISNEELKERKWKDFFGTLVTGGAAAAGAYVGIRRLPVRPQRVSVRGFGK